MPATQPRANARQGRVHAVAIDAGGWVDLLWEGRWQHQDGPEAATAEDIRNVLRNLQAEANAEEKKGRASCFRPTLPRSQEKPVPGLTEAATADDIRNVLRNLQAEANAEEKKGRASCFRPTLPPSEKKGRASCFRPTLPPSESREARPWSHVPVLTPGGESREARPWSLADRRSQEKPVPGLPGKGNGSGR